MLKMDYEEEGSSRLKPDFTDFGMQDPKALSEDRTLNFSTSMAEDYDVTFAKKPKTIRDPMSHRIIEKRRRDRMNNCLADLSRLIPTDYLKQGQGRIEKTEIIEMAIKHIKNLTNMVSKQGGLKSSLPDRYIGFKECQDEVMRFLVEVEGWDAADRLCIMLMAHLEQAGEKFRIMNDQSLSQVAKEEQYRHADEELNRQPNGLVHTLEPAGQQTEFSKDGYQNVMPYQAQPYPQEGLTPAQQRASDSGNSTPQTYPQYEQLLTAQQITQEHLKRDKHLWTLLTSKYSPQVEDSGISMESGVSTTNSKEGKNTKSESSFRIQHESSPAFNSSTQDTGSEKMDSSVYKFKHNITKRFSQEEKKINQSDTSSSSSREEKRNEKVKRKVRHVRSRSPSSSGSSNYPNSSSSNNNSSSSAGKEKVHVGTKSQTLLPGFILHPNGTHYIPLSINPSSFSTNLFSTSHSCIYHPISIPVNFGGPVLHMKKVTVERLKTETCTQSSESMDSPSGCGSMENSVGNFSSDSSPSPDQEMMKPAGC